MKLFHRFFCLYFPLPLSSSSFFFLSLFYFLFCGKFFSGKGRRRTGMHAESSGFEVDDSEMSAVERAF